MGGDRATLFILVLAWYFPYRFMFQVIGVSLVAFFIAIVLLFVLLS